jgi:hypothetical protein
MIVRLLRPWKAQRVGKILAQVPDGVANLLIKRKFAVEVQPEVNPPEPETVVKPEKPKRVR